jgi:hypothetical protein
MYVARTRRILTDSARIPAVSRISCVPYHQNVSDLLRIESGVCPKAARMIATHEARHGPLSASVREWYRVPGVVSTERGGYRSEVGWYGNLDNPPRSLQRVIAQFARRPTDVPRSYICFMDGHMGRLPRGPVRRTGTHTPPGQRHHLHLPSRWRNDPHHGGRTGADGRAVRVVDSRRVARTPGRVRSSLAGMGHPAPDVVRGL